MKKTKEKKKCEQCYECGWWPVGPLSPISPIDAGEWGQKVVKCPWCGAGHAKGERYEHLARIKRSMNGLV
jgi:hypothetical protein